MRHRHLDHDQLTLAAIDDIIARGRRADWEALREASLKTQSVLEKVRRVCAPHTNEPRAQRYQFWMHYAEQHA
jgi:hypothetical protein